MAAKRIKVRALELTAVSEITIESVRQLKELGHVPEEVDEAEFGFRFYESKNRIDFKYHEEFDPEHDFVQPVPYNGSFAQITRVIDMYLNKLLICEYETWDFVEQVAENLNHRIDRLINDLMKGREKNSYPRINKVTFNEQLYYLRKLRKSIIANKFIIERFDYNKIEFDPSVVKLNDDTGFIRIDLKVKDGEQGEIIDLVSGRKSTEANDSPTGRSVDANYITCVFYIICKSKGLSITGKINDRVSYLFAKTIVEYFFKERESDSLHKIEYEQKVEFDKKQLVYLESISRRKPKPLQEATVRTYFKSNKRFNFIGPSISFDARIATIRSICNHKAFKTDPSFQSEYKFFLADPKNYLGIPH